MSIADNSSLNLQILENVLLERARMLPLLTTVTLRLNVCVISVSIWFSWIEICPRLDGIETSRRIRRISASLDFRISVILTSATNADVIERVALDVG